MAMDLEKENICPSTGLHLKALRADPFPKRKRTSSSSPLPASFPRSPLQDITRQVLLAGPVFALNSQRFLDDESDDGSELESSGKRFKAEPSVCVSNSVERHIRVSRAVDPKEIGARLSEPEIRVLDRLDHERERDITQSECSEDDGASFSSSSSAKAEPPSETSTVKSVEELNKVLPVPRAMNRKRKQTMACVIPSASRFIMASSNVQESKSKVKSSVLKFR
jgi:hypothetical protein